MKTFFTILTLAIYARAAANLGTGSGTVVDSAGKPIAGPVRIFISLALDAAAIKTPAPPVQTGPHITSRVAGESGAFVVKNLAPGKYVACASTSIPGYLDPCQWSSTGAQFTISAGQVTPGINLVLEKGAIIPIRVNDAAQKLLTDQLGPHDSEFQIHAVTVSGRHILAAITGQDRSGRDQTITVPFGAAVRLQVFSKKVAFVDSANKLLAPGGFIVTVPFGAIATPITLNITGAK